MIKLVVSGGQTGADQAALAAAKDKGIATNGYAPKGFITLEGPNIKLKELYNIREHPSSQYAPRTYANVKFSDGTIRFASNFSSAGEKCTLKAIKLYNKPYLDIDIKNPLSVKEIKKWIKDNEIKILNVAGNSERTSPGIFDFVYKYLSEVLKDD